MSYPLTVDRKFVPAGIMLRITICLSAPVEINFSRLFCWFALFSSVNLIDVIVLE
jgi:hypothetical protein